MAAVAGRLSRQTLLKAKSVTNTPKSNFSFKTASKGKKAAFAAIGTATLGGLGIVGAALGTPVLAEELVLEPAEQHWNHHRLWESLDMRSVRRGYEVYKQVCSACHSLKHVCYREMVGAFFSEAEAKAEAKEALITDGPDDAGQMFQRPGRLADVLPAPYKNDEEAKAANNGAVPPDLSYIVKAREGHEDYIFGLLTGYCDPPEGVAVMPDTHFNPYFQGGVIAMAAPLYTDIIEYSDGTPATKSQLAKDVTTFLVWTSEIEMDDRKRLAMKMFCFLALMTGIALYSKRHNYSVIKNRKIALKRN